MTLKYTSLNIIPLTGWLMLGTVSLAMLSETINTFKSPLDKFCQHQDMIYDFQAEL